MELTIHIPLWFIYASIFFTLLVIGRLLYLLITNQYVRFFLQKLLLGRLCFLHTKLDNIETNQPVIITDIGFRFLKSKWVIAHRIKPLKDKEV